MQLSTSRVFGAVSDEGADITAAMDIWNRVPCSAHVQQTALKDLYISEIREPIPMKNGGVIINVQLQCTSIWRSQ